MKKIFLLVMLTFLSIRSLADVDEYNSYRWNRENFNKGNQEIDNKSWYEWWYYKVVDQNTGDAFFFCYGVVNPWDEQHKEKGTRAAVAAGDFQIMNYAEQIFPVKNFSAAYDDVFVKIGPDSDAKNIARENHIQGQFTDKDGQQVSWDLDVQKVWGFNAMGWAMHKKNVANIYWYPAQASAVMNGWVNFKGKVYRLQNATAYQDRNWGRSFPKWWTWLVSNNFKDHPGTALVAGGGYPKALDKAYTIDGLVIGLNHEGQEYSFRTNDGDQIRMNIKWGTWEVRAVNRHNYRIIISAYAPPEKFMLLPFETPQGEQFKDYEALQGHMKVSLEKFSYTHMRWQKVVDLETEQAGIEWGSPKAVDLKQLFRKDIVIY